MREILFRGKRKDNGEWVEGLPVQIYRNTRPTSRWDIITGENIDELDYDVPMIYESYEVDPDTIGQYTGLTDMNGTKIFEGDILRGWDSYQDDICIAGTVMYGEGQSYRDIYKYQGWYLRSGEDRTEYISQGNIEYFEYEVAGNIHDNAELLKKGLSQEGPDR